MNAKSRISLSVRIKNFFIDEIKKSCGEDFYLIEDRIQELTNVESLREAIYQAKAAIDQTKRSQRSEKRGSVN